MLLPTINTSLRRALEQWFETEGLRPVVSGEFEDPALLTTFGESGRAVFPAPTAIEGEVVRSHRVAVVGRTSIVTGAVLRDFCRASPQTRGSRSNHERGPHEDVQSKTVHSSPAWQSRLMKTTLPWTTLTTSPRCGRKYWPWHQRGLGASDVPPGCYNAAHPRIAFEALIIEGPCKSSASSSALLLQHQPPDKR